MTYWFVNDGVTDNCVAWNTRMPHEALNAHGATITLPPGKYRFDSAISFDFPANRAFKLTIQGEGAVLYWPNASGGMTFNMSSAGHSLTMSGMHITTGAPSGGCGLVVKQSDPLRQFFMSSFRDMVFRGDENDGHSGSASYWSVAAYVENLSGTSWDTITILGGAGPTAYLGAGIVFAGTGVGGITGPNYAIMHNIDKCILNQLDTGLIYGAYAQGISIDQTNMQNTKVGVLVQPDAGGDLSQLMISNSQFGGCEAALITLSAIGNVQLVNNDIFGVAGHAVVYLAKSFGATIVGNNIAVSAQSGSYGILIGNGPNAYPVVITGNTIVGAGIGVQIEVGASNVAVVGNAFAHCAIPVQAEGPNAYVTGNLGTPTGVASAPVVEPSPWVYTAGAAPEVLYLAASRSIDNVVQDDGTPILPNATGPNENMSFMLAPHAALAIGYTGVLTARGTKL